jgi:hypothetical protein
MLIDVVLSCFVTLHKTTLKDICDREYESCHQKYLMDLKLW